MPRKVNEDGVVFANAFASAERPDFSDDGVSRRFLIAKVHNVILLNVQVVAQERVYGISVRDGPREVLDRGAFVLVNSYDHRMEYKISAME